MWFDAHTHSEELPPDGRRLLLAGTDRVQASRAIRFRSQNPTQVFLALGLHPWWAKTLNKAQVEEEVLKLEALLTPHACAVGETGLDFSPKHLLGDTQVIQELAFRLQLKTAKRHGLPLVLHIVRAEARACEILQKEMGNETIQGMVHGFSSGPEQARELLQRGLHLSIGGAILQDRFKRLRSAISEIPEDRLLIESETPSESDDPGRLLQVAEKLASLRGSQAERLLKTSHDQLCKLLKLTTHP